MSTLSVREVRVDRPAAISLIGAKANQYLSSPGFSGEVISAGSRAAYIATGNGEILAACRADQHPHPRSFLTDLDLAELEVGLAVSVEGDELRFSNGVRLSLIGSQIWNPPVPNDANPASPSLLQSRWHDLIQESIALHQGENLGLAIPLLSESTRAKQISCSSPLVAAGLEQVEKLLPACRSGDLGKTLTMAEDLIGLGHGLTPSGDDFVGGLVIMHRRLEAVYPTSDWWEGGDVSALLETSERMTSKISQALLVDLAEGRSHAPLHDLVNDLFSGTGEFVAAKHVRNISDIGQSSGWDMLTGMLAGLLPVINRS